MINKDNKEIMKNNTTRVVLNVPNDIDEKFKNLAVKRGIAKSQMILFAMSWYLENNKTMELMPKLLDFLNNKDYENFMTESFIKQIKENK